MTFRMKMEPKKPVRNSGVHAFCLSNDNYTINDLLNLKNNINIIAQMNYLEKTGTSIIDKTAFDDPKRLKIYIDHDYDYSELYVEIPFNESDTSFGRRFNHWRKVHQEWEKWKNKNHTEIEEYIQKKEIEKEEKIQRQKQRMKTKIQKEINVKEKELIKLKKCLVN